MFCFRFFSIPFRHPAAHYFHRWPMGILFDVGAHSVHSAQWVRVRLVTFKLCRRIKKNGNNKTHQNQIAHCEIYFVTAPSRLHTYFELRSIIMCITIFCCCCCAPQTLLLFESHCHFFDFHFYYCDLLFGHVVCLARPPFIGTINWIFIIRCLLVRSILVHKIDKNKIPKVRTRTHTRSQPNANDFQME